MKNPVTWYLIGLLILLTFLIGCQSPKYLSNQNLESLYNPSGNQLAPKLHIFHKTPNKPQLFAKVPLRQLRYESEGAGSNTRFKVSYRIYKNYEYRTLFDSGSRSFWLSKKQMLKQDHTQTVQFDIPKADQYYLVEAEVQDLVADQKARTFIYYRPYEKAYDQRFLLRHASNEELHTANFISCGQPLTIKTASATDSLIIKRYPSDQFNSAAPPFKENLTNRELSGISSDSSFKVATDQVIRLENKGFFSIQGRSNAATIALRVVNSHFPKLKRPEQLRSSIRYLTNSSNFKDLNAKEPKPAVDQFWLNKADNNTAKAKEMIQHYYRRVQKSNTYFTNYKKGWKTDRGMIYIVFGKPYIVYRTNQQEVWIYANRTSMPNLEFRFERKQDPLAPVYFNLKRSRYYKEPFYKSIERLRESNDKP